MSLVYIATLPESLTVSNVATYDVTSASQPRTILGRRSGLDELIYDEEGGFSDSWKGFSSLTPTDDGFTLVLGRRAFSAAGVAVFFAGGGGGGGGTLAGDVTGPAGTNTVVKVQGVPVAAPTVSGDVPHYDGTNIVWSAPSAGVGDVVGPSSAVADRIATFDGTTGKLLKDGGQTIAQVIASAAAPAPVCAQYSLDGPAGKRISLTTGSGWINYSGFTYGNQAGGTASSWGPLLTHTDIVKAAGNSSSFTIAQAGKYHVESWMNWYYASNTDHTALRVTVNGTALLTQNSLLVGISNCRISGIVDVPAGATLVFEFSAQAGLPLDFYLNTGTASVDSAAIGGMTIQKL